MANEKTFQARIALKYDTHENWVANNPILLAGELALTTVSVAQAGSVNSVPSVLIKVGDGVHHYNELNYASGLAADVYDWAKAATKPSYAATEIQNLTAFIENTIQDTDTQYKIEKKANDDYTYILKSAPKGGSTWTEVSTISIPKYDDTEVKGDIEALQGLVGDTSVASQIGTAIAALSDVYYGKAAGEANAAAIAGIKDGTTIDSFADVEAALAKKQDNIPANTYDVYGAAAGVQGATTKTVKDVEGEAAAALEAAQGAQATADAKVASVTAGNLGISMGGTATAPTVGVKISAKEGNHLSIQQGEGEEGLYVNVPAQTDYSVSVAESTPEGVAKRYVFSQCGASIATIDIPKDMVVESGEVVVDPQGQPKGTYLKLVLANATEDVIYINVSDLIEYVTSGSQAGDMVVIDIDAQHKVTASITDGTITLAKLAQAVQDEIAKAHTHDNKALLDTYTQTEANLADAVAKKHEHSNKTELDKFVTGDKDKLDAAYADKHTHANKTELDKIADGDKAKWDAEIGAMAKATANETAISGIKDGTELDSFGDVETKFGTMNTEVGKKADKVTGATAGNFAGLDANGNLTDSGKKAADFDVAGAAEAAETAAKAYADGLDEAMDTRMTAAETKLDNLKIEELGQTNFFVISCGSSSVNI